MFVRIARCYNISQNHMDIYGAALTVIHFSGQVSACVLAEQLNHKAKITEATET